MPVFEYTAKDVTGKIVKGTIGASTVAEASNMIKQRNQTPVKVEPKKVDILSKIGLRKDTVDIKNMAIFARQFATIMKAGVPIAKSLDILRKQTEDRVLKSSIDEIYEDVQKGLSLSKAMQRQGAIFSSLFVSMVEVGELSGTLDNSLNKMANQLEKDMALQKKIKGALTYPIILSVVVVIVVIVLMAFVVPQFKTIFEQNGSTLPAITQVLLNISDSVVKYWYVYAGVIISVVAGVKYYLSTPNGSAQWDKFLITFPVLKDLTQKQVTAKFARVSATMIGSGVSLLNTIEAAEKVVDNKVAEEALKRIKEDVVKGSGLRNPISKEQAVFPIMLSHMVGIGEESGSLDEMMEKTADFFESEVDDAIDKVTALIEPAILVIMALIVGTIVISILVPMMSINELV